MIEFLIISGAFAWFFFALFSKRFDYLDGHKDKTNSSNDAD